MKFRSALVVVSLLLSLFTSADHKSINCEGCWQPAPQPIAINEAFGVNVHFLDPNPEELRLIADAGFRWIRTDFKWELTERERGKFDFAIYDRLLNTLDREHLRALFILDYGNPLYTSGKSIRTAEAREAFARWSVAAAKHFHGRGIVWELFNEPNNEMFWPPKPDADEYLALAQTVTASFGQEAPSERLIGPGSAGIDFKFLEACFKARVPNDWDAVSVHPYRQSAPETVAAEYARLREVIDRKAHGGKETNSAETLPIFSGEWGYSSAWRGMDEDRQATLLARQFLTNIANGIPLSIWYDWRDDGADPRAAEDHFGLIRFRSDNAAQSLQPKPAYLAAKTLIANLSGFTFQERLSVGSDDDYVLVFAKADERRYAVWTTAATPHRITIPHIDETCDVIPLTGTRSNSISPNDHRLLIELTSSPVYLTRSK